MGLAPKLPIVNVGGLRYNGITLKKVDTMIDFDNTTKPNLMFFADEGSWGDASDIVIVDVSELDGHFTEVIDEVSDHKRPEFMRWYVDNQTHDQTMGEYTNCTICELWETGTEDEILEELDV